MAELPPGRRHSARVLLLDGVGRILLLRFRVDASDPGRGHGWVTPGGGVNDGEPVQHAAARELREEIGLVVTPFDLGRPIAYSTGCADLGRGPFHFHDDFFSYRVDGHDVDVTSMEALERIYHAGHRWWPLEELAASTEIIYPLRLASLVADVLAGRVFDRPVELPWHH